MSPEFDGGPVTEIQILRLQPGDVLVLKVPPTVSQEEQMRFSYGLRKFLDDAGHPTVRAMVLPDSCELEVVRQVAEGED